MRTQSHSIDVSRTAFLLQPRFIILRQSKIMEKNQKYYISNKKSLNSDYHFISMPACVLTTITFCLLFVSLTLKWKELCLLKMWWWHEKESGERGVEGRRKCSLGLEYVNTFDRVRHRTNVNQKGKTRFSVATWQIGVGVFITFQGNWLPSQKVVQGLSSRNGN